MLKTILKFIIGKSGLPASSNLKAQIQLSALITGIKGAVSGSLFQGGKTGTILRTKSSRKPSTASLTFSSPSAEFVWSGCMAQSLDITGFVMPDGSYRPSVKTSNAQQNLKVVSKAWSKLLESDRATWASVSSNLQTKDRFGKTYTPSPFQSYMQINTMLINAGLSPVARTSCYWTTIIEGQETYHCWVCGDTIVYCLYIDPTKNDTVNGRTFPGIQTHFIAGGTNGYLVVTASRPQSLGRNSANAIKKVIAVMQRVDTYDSFILSLMLNKFFGANIFDSNIQITQSLVNTGGAFVRSSSSVVNMAKPIPGKAISYTLKAATFIWVNTESTLNFGSSPTGTPVVKTVLFFANGLVPLTSYTLSFTQGLENNFSFIYGDLDNPLDLGTLKTDQYGNILPIPLQITFNALSTGAKTASTTIAYGGSESLIINLTGSGT